MTKQLEQDLEKFRAEYPLKDLKHLSHDWRYYLAGDETATPLLLLHGGGADADAIFPYILHFSTNFRVIAPNIPSSINKIADAVAGLRAVLNQENIGKVHLVGISFGAMLAQLYARRFGDALLNMVLSHATIPSKHLAEISLAQLQIMQLQPAPLLMWQNRRSYRHAIARSICELKPEERQFWQNYFDEAYAKRFSKVHLISRARITTDYHQNHSFQAHDLQAWDGNLLIIESAEDEIISEGDRGAMKGMYAKAYVQSLEGCDHLAPILHAQELAASMSRFLLMPSKEFTLELR